jgi:hypothetical protein
MSSGGGTMQINDSAIQQYIADYRDKTELAYKLDLNPSTLYNIAAGRRKPGRKVLVALSRHGLPTNQLLTEQE